MRPELIKPLIPKGLRPVARRIYRMAYPPGLVRTLTKTYCAGRGIEIGPGKTPYGDPSNTISLDKHTTNKDATPNPDIVADSGKLPLADSVFDFLISSHCLEHCQNTLKVLKEWIRILKPEGILFLVLPHGDRTLDRFREKTTLQHHIEDLERLTDEPDRSHIDEIVTGWSKHPNQELRAANFRQQWGADRWDWNFRFKNDVIHFHVWTQHEIIEVLMYLGMRIIYATEIVPEREDSFVVIARKSHNSKVGCTESTNQC